MATKYMLITCFLLAIVVSVSAGAGNKIKGKRKIKSNVSRPPNVIVLFADDLGFGDLSFSGHPTSRTPHIDQLAANGRFFNQFYVTSPVCSPSRAALLTGRLQVRSGVYPGVFTPDNTLGLPRNETTIAQLLQGQGYRTMILGKWHLGVGAKGEYLPTHFGFDEYYGVPYSHDMCPCRVCFPDGGSCYDNCWEQDVSCPLFSNTTILEQPVSLPTLSSRYLNRALGFISDAHHKNQSFFLYFPTHQIHHPQFASKKFHGKSARGRTGDALMELDWMVGEITLLLRKLRIDSSTVIWFASDNGPSLTRHERGGCAGPLRCGKGTTWEGGVRVPSFVYWPGKVRAGRTNGLVSSLDILPTLAALTNANTSSLTLDGVDVSSLLWSPDNKSPREMFPVYSEGPARATDPYAVTDGKFKAHFFTKGSDLSDASNYDPMCPQRHPLTRHDPPLLFDIQQDPGERYNLANDTLYQPVLEALTKWRNEHIANVTWMPPRTRALDAHAQPCCTTPSCNPFPGCCDCPRAALNPLERFDVSKPKQKSRDHEPMN